MKEEIEGLKEILLAIITGGILNIMKSEKVWLLRGYVVVMIAWYFIDIVQRLDILSGGREYQLDLQFWYIFVDISTLFYVLLTAFNLRPRPAQKMLFWFLVGFLSVWFLRYTAIDIMDTPLEQDNTPPFHFLMMFVDTCTIGFMSWCEGLKYWRTRYDA